jgi:dipeptidyl aminopeptidase/acylaminoacyl peptidase
LNVHRVSHAPIQNSTESLALAHAVLELTSGVFSRLTFNPAGDLNPVWSPDGRGLVFSSTRNGHLDLYEKPLGGGDERAPF